VYQAAWWGHPITTGLPSIDYFLSLEDEVDDAQSHYSEQLVRFTHINTVPLAAPYSFRLKRVLHATHSGQRNTDKPGAATEQDLAQFLADTANDEARLRELGFPLDSDFCMVLGRLFKLHPEFDAILVDLIWNFHTRGRAGGERTDRSPFIVLIAGDLHELNDIVYERILLALQQKLSSEEVSAEDAVHIMQQHLKVVGYGYYHTLLRSARVVLDTFPYGGKLSTVLVPFTILKPCHLACCGAYAGCLTSHDALSHSVPMVTLPSTFLR
jgi:hypothetical protein